MLQRLRSGQHPPADIGGFVPSLHTIIRHCISSHFLFDSPISIRKQRSGSGQQPVGGVGAMSPFGHVLSAHLTVEQSILPHEAEDTKQMNIIRRMDWIRFNMALLAESSNFVDVSLYKLSIGQVWQSCISQFCMHSAFNCLLRRSSACSTHMYTKPRHLLKEWFLYKKKCITRDLFILYGIYHLP